MVSTGQIAGYFTAESAASLAAVLRSGPLPFPVQEVPSATGTPAPATATPIADQVPSPMPPGWTSSVEISSPWVTVPAPQPGATFLVYVVVYGDTMDAISAGFNVSLDSLVAANPGLDIGGILRVGRQLNIPAP